MTFGRGPDPVELALAKYSRAVLALLEAEQLYLRRVDDVRDGETALREVGFGVPALHLLSRETRNAKRMREGVPFFDRDVPEPIGNGMPMLEPGP